MSHPAMSVWSYADIATIIDHALLSPTLTAAEAEATKTEAAAKKADTEKTTAEQAHAAAKVTVTRAQESTQKAEQKIPPVRVEYETLKLAEKTAVDELAMAERVVEVRGKRIKALESRRSSAEKLVRETAAQLKATAAAEKAEKKEADAAAAQAPAQVSRSVRAQSTAPTTSAPMPTQFSIGVDLHRHTCGTGTFSSLSPLEISSYRYRGTLQPTCQYPDDP
jgi:hypothetical protein